MGAYHVNALWHIYAALAVGHDAAGEVEHAHGVAIHGLDGGAGNDSLNGGNGNDTYLFGKGSGKDSINNYDNTAGKLDRVLLGAGITAADVSLSRDGDALVLALNGRSDSLSISNYFNNDASGNYQVEQLVFADGTVWDVAAVRIRNGSRIKTFIGFY